MTTPNIEELHGLAKEFEDRGCHIDDIGFNSGSTSVNELMRRYFEGLIANAPALLDALQSQAERMNALEREIERLTESLRYEVDCVAAIGAERDQACVELAAMRAQAEGALGYLNKWQKNGGTKAGYEFVDAAITELGRGITGEPK